MRSPVCGRAQRRHVCGATNTRGPPAVKSHGFHGGLHGAFTGDQTLGVAASRDRGMTERRVARRAGRLRTVA